MGTIPFNATSPDLEAVREIIFERLRREPGWQQLDHTGEGYAGYVDFVGSRNLRALVFAAQEVFWELVIEGILAPGIDSSNLNLPWFHVTRYGQNVVQSGTANPHDPTGYLKRLSEKIPNPDSTVVAYLAESLATFRGGNRVASTVMLGIAAERVFLLLCESLTAALADPNEHKAFAKILDRFPMKPKLDWVHQKIQSISKAHSKFPDNANIMLTVIFDFVRTQRNELGHPREVPPNVSREDAFVNLQVFPRYYQTAEEVRAFLSNAKV